MKIRALVVENWPIKLTSLGLAAVLWAAVAAEEPASQLVPVTLMVEPPPGRALTRPLPPVRALYTGSARELVKLYHARPMISAVLPDTLSSPTYVLDLSPGDLKLATKADVTPRDVQPRRIEIHLDAVSQRLLPVLSRITIQPDSGFAVVGGLALSPSSVLVRGPRAALDKLEAVATVPLALTGVREPVHRTVPLDVTTLGVAQPARRDVEMQAEVEAISERALLDVPVSVVADRGTWAAEPASVMVSLRGPARRIARLSRDSISVLATPSGAGRRETARLLLIPPAGIEAQATPDTVRLQRTGDA
jgi:hypothetical protein